MVQMTKILFLIVTMDLVALLNTLGLMVGLKKIYLAKIVNTEIVLVPTLVVLTILEYSTMDHILF